MSKRDYYKVLDVARDATEAEIKKAYRRLAMKFHPGPQSRRHGSRGEVQGGQGSLRGSDRRAEARGLRPVRPRRRRRRAAAAAAASMPADAFGDIFGDVFGDIFGGGRRGRSPGLPRRRPALRAWSSISSRPSLAPASTSTSRHCRVRGLQGQWRGEGLEPVTCDTCNGRASVRVSQGFFSVQQTCPRCQGPRPDHQRTLRHLPRPGPGSPQEEAVGQDPGRRRQRATASGSPAKAKPGATAGRRAISTSRFSVREHAIFERDGSHLSCEVPDQLRDGHARRHGRRADAGWPRHLKVPAETQSGRVFRLARKGRSARCAAAPVGDLFCRVVVETPVNLTREQKDLLRKLDESLRRRSQAAQSARAGLARGRQEVLREHRQR